MLFSHSDIEKAYYASATATKDRLIVKQVNTNAYAIQAQLNLPDVHDGKHQISLENKTAIPLAVI